MPAAYGFLAATVFLNQPFWLGYRYMGLSHDLGNARIGRWVKDHLEVSNEIMEELGFEGEREMQKLMAGPDFEAKKPPGILGGLVLD